MASNPPFQVEDTDEDFFDKLVNDVDDDYKVTPLFSEGTNLAGGNDSDDAKAFDSLSISDVGTGIESSGKVGKRVEEEDIKASSSINGDVKYESTDTCIDPAQQLVSSSYFAFNSVSEEPKTEATELEELLDSTARWNHGPEGSPGVKEVQWAAFTEPVESGNNGFESYNDLFSEFGDNSIDQLGKGGNLVSGAQNFILGNSSVVDDSLHTENVNDYSHKFHEVQANAAAGEQSTDGQDPNSWENLYPGWKYDANTGQWYQVNEGYDAAANVKGEYNLNTASEWTVSNEKPEVSYLQQTVQSAVGSIAEKGMTESVTRWNPVSQGSYTNESLLNWDPASQENNGYPSHMIFDPQYPGWYYDMIAQEWRSLDAYNSQPIVQAQDQVNQNGFSATNTYYGNDKTYGGKDQLDKQSESEVFSRQDYKWKGSFSNFEQQGSTMWQPAQDQVNQNGFSASNTFYGNDQKTYGGKDQLDKQSGSEVFGGQGQGYQWKKSFNNVGQQVSTIWQPDTAANSASMPDFRGNKLAQNHHHGPSFPLDNHVNQQQAFDFRNKIISNQSGHQASYASSAGRSSAGRPPHALVTFGFGGKLIVMKDSTTLINSSYGNQDSNGRPISVLNLAEVSTGGTDVSSSGASVCDYFNTLGRQSFLGPLAGGNVGGKELNKWLDERITHSESSNMDYRSSEVLKLLLSLLKIASQQYGKLRSPFGADATLKENDAPEVAVARLFASVRTNSAEYSDNGHFTNCLQPLPSEGETRANAAEVQTLLVSGRKIEALQCAQEGQFWGPALVLAAQLGDQFYVDTIRKMALCQLVPGSPLRTLCLLIAGQPTDAFSTDPKTDGDIPGAVNMSQQMAQPGANCMLDDWIENLAVITSNRTKDDELVLIHLGDCLWKERSNIMAAHICYLVAEANFEPYSDSARLCLIGADHWKQPRTYVSPEAIQRTEVYEYAKLLGNSQFTLLPFQPYKLIYAHMLAEVGRLSDSLKYCQSISKSLKTGRAPEVETWRQLVLSLEDRIRTHQQGGFSTNLAAGKLVGKLFNLFDSTAQRVVGGLPPPIPSTSGGGVQNGHHHQPTGPRVSTSQSTMAMSSLVPSASMEPMNQWSDEGNNRKIIHNRSVSEPDFGRSPSQVDPSKENSVDSQTKYNQVDPSKENSADSQTKASEDTSRLSRFSFGSQLLQKTVGLVLKSRGDKQAKLGDSNKFYYDEKLKRWVEEGVDPPAEEAALPPPPTMTTFQNGTSDYNLKSALKSEGPQSNGNSEFTGPMSMAHSSGIPPIPATSNQFSARGRIGVRARYVDTFNKVGGNTTNLFQSPAAPIIKPATNPNPKFFVPTASPLAEQPADTCDNTQLSDSDVFKENDSFSGLNRSFQFTHPSSAMSRQKFASMDNVSEARMGTRRTASWAGNGQQGFSFSNRSELKPVGVGLEMNDELQEVDF